MTVRHRIQNFPDGGGAIGPAAPGAAATMYGPVAGSGTGTARAGRAPGGGSGVAGKAPEGGEEGGGGGGVAVVSTCGSV